jgi:hypothetical protein
MMTTAQITLWDDGAPAVPPLVYRSGASARSDFSGFARAGVPVGVEIGSVSRPVEELLVEYNGAGGLAFVDTGAFGAFRRGGRVDFDEVLARYRSLLARARRRGALALVMPDVVGDQGATLDLLLKHRDQVREFVAAGADVIVPLQKGALDLAAFYAVVVEALGTDDFRVGLPTREAAVGEGELLEFVAAVRPARLHLLGIARGRRFAPLVGHIAALSPRTHVSSDANHLRALVGSGRPLTVAVETEIRERAAECSHTGDAAKGLPDETEFVGSLYGTPDYLTPAMARAFARAVTDDETLRAEIERAAVLGVRGEEFGSPLGDVLEREFPGAYGEMVVWKAYYALVKKAVGSEVREHEIARLETRRGAAGKLMPGDATDSRSRTARLAWAA